MTSPSWRERLYRRRWWLAVLLVLVVVRVALPEVVRRVIVSQASEALNARIDVGDVDLRLWRGGISLEDVAVREKGAPEPPPPPEETDENASPPPFGPYSPIVGFKRFAVELHYLPLFSKTIQLREVTIELPRVALDRLGSGEFNVMALAPGEGAEEPAASDEESSDWKFGVDKFVLEDGRIRFRDMTLEGSEPIEVGIDRISVDDVALTPAVYGKPGHIALKLGIDEGTVDVVANLALNGSQVNVTTEITANRLPLRRARLYVPNVGWSELRGELDLDLIYELEAEKTNALHGTLALRDVAVQVPNLEDAAVGWKSLAVNLERIDLLAQRAAVQEVALDGAEVAVRVRGGGLLPVLAQKAGAAAKSAASATPMPTERVGQTAAPSTPGPGLISTGVAPTESTTPDASSPTASSSREEGRTETPTTAPEDIVAAATPPVGDEDIGTERAPATSTGTPTAAGPEAEPSPTRRSEATAPVSTAAQPEEDAVSETFPTPTATPLDGASGAAAASPAVPPEEPPATTWGWQVTSVRVTDSKLRVLSDQAPLDVGVDLSTENLSGDADVIGHVTLALAVEPGTVTLDGDVRVAPVPAFGGTLKITDLSLPALPVVSSVLSADALTSGNLRSDLVISAGLPAPAGDQVAADRLGVGGTIGLAELKLSPPQAPDLTLELSDLELRIDKLEVPGVIPPGQPAAAGTAINLIAGLSLSEPHLTRGGEDPLSVAAESIGLEVPSLAVPAALAGLGPGDGVSLVSGALGLDLAAPRISLGDDDMTVQAQQVALQVTDATLPVLPPSAGTETIAAEGAVPDSAEPPAAPAGAPPTSLALQLDVGSLEVATGQGRELNAGAESIALALTDIVVPGFVAGASLTPSNDPLRAKGDLRLVRTRVTRGDGKELSIQVDSIEVPLQSLELPGVPGGFPPGVTVSPLRAAFGKVELETPVIRVTRRKEGVVVPVIGTSGAAEQTSPPPASEAEERPGASQPIELQIAALRLRGGELEFIDRAVRPKFSTRLAPIEIDARNIKFPAPQVKSLKVDITSEEQGQITIRGDLEPNVSTLELDVERLALAPFDPYATAYSPYGIADGALSIEIDVTASGGKYDVKNHIRLHQFDLAGTEGDSVFEENFGISLSMALALLRDLQGDINLSVPLEVDREGNAQVDVMAVVRSALRRAITGAITSPLKMLGAVAGGPGTPIAPSPVTFRLGRAQTTDKGGQAAERLAAFLASRPAMGVRLSSAATAADERWLHEQTLAGDFEEENFFQRSLAFVTKRGPRERIGAYLSTRRKNKKASLSAEDTAQLEEWLAERPPPTTEQLMALAEARIAAVETVLREAGIDPSRITRGEPPEEPEKPTVDIKLRALPVGAATEPPA